MKPSRRNPLFANLFRSNTLTTAIVVSLGSSAAQAADLYWDRGAATNAWGTASNWSTVPGAATPNPAAAPGASDVAIFNISTLNTAQTIDMGAARSVLGLGFVSTGTVLIQGGGTARTLTIGANGISKTGTGAVTIGSTTGTQNANIALGANQTWTNSAAGDLIALNVISGAFNLNLAGSGTFRFAGGNTYSGTTTIGAGTTLIAQSNAALGSNAAGTIISSGGTLNLGGTLGGNSLNLGTEAISVSGTGVGGNGAIVNTGTNGQQNAIAGVVTLTGDTTFGGTQRWDIRNGTLNGANFNLTKVGTNSVFLSGNAQIGSNLGSLTVRQGEFVMETGAVATSTNITSGITLQPTTAVTAAFRSWGNKVDHTANITMDSSFAGSSTRLEVQNGVTIHSGTITATAGDNRLDVDSDQRMVLNGVLAGGGNFSKEDTGLLLVNNALNTQSGLFTVNFGTLGGGGTLASSTVAITNGTVISPGNAQVSSGALTVTNILGLSGTNSAVFNLGASSDVVNAGTLNQDGTTNIFVVPAAGFTPGTYTLFDYGTLGGTNGAAGFSIANSHVDGVLVNNLVNGSIDLTLNSLTPLRWTGASNGLWNSGSVTNPSLSNFQWTPDPDGKVEFVNYDNVLFDDTNTGTTSIRVNSIITPASIEFNNSALDYTVDSAAPGIAAGNISGNTGLVKNGSGTLTLLGANTFNGAIDLNAGTLQLGNESRTGTLNGGNSPAINLAPGTTLGIANGSNGAVTYASDISGSGSIVLNASQQDPYFNYASDRGNVNLSGDNSGFTGTITINDGNRLGITKANQLGGASGVVIQDGGAFITNAALAVSTPFSIAGKGWSETIGMLGALRVIGGATLSGPITMTGDSRITAFSGSGTISGAIGGAFNLELGFNHTGTGSGTLTLSNPASTYSGDTSITRMTINADNIANSGVNSSLGSGDDIAMNASTLTVTGAGPMTSDRTLTLGELGIGGNNIGITNPATTLTLTGTINNAQPVAASGSAFRQGLNFQQTATAGTGGTVILNTATPIITSGTTVHRQNLTLAGNTNFTVGASGFGSAGTFNLGASTGTDVGDATLTIQDNAVLNVYGEFDIGNQGVAQTYVVNQSGNSVVNALRGGGAGSDSNIINRAMRIGHWPAQNTTYNLTGGTLNVPNGHLWVGWDGQATFNQSAGTTVNSIGLRMVNGSTLAVAYNLNGGTLNIGAYGFAKGGSGTSVPQFNFNGGTYRATADHAISSNIAINIQNGGGTIDTNGFNVTSGSRLIGVGNGAFTKAGNGELVLPAGDNDYTGATNITGGTLTLGADTSRITASSLTTVGDGGTLAGVGGVTAAGGVSVADGGTLSPGLSGGRANGTLTVATASFVAGSAVDITPAAAGGDLLAVTGAMSGNVIFNMLPVGSTPLAAGTYTLATAGTNSLTTAALGAYPHLADGSSPLLSVTAGAVTVTTSAAADPMIWSGAAGSNWDITTVNQWNGLSGHINNNAAAYFDGDLVTFNGTSLVGNVTVQAGGVRPANVSIDSSSTAYTLTGGGISGGASLTHVAGTTVLANNNSYLGTTTITAGTLQIGNGGTSGSLGLGATTNDGTLAFNRSDATSYSGVISGSGIVRSDGTGVTTLNGLNTYSGGTVISKGTLQGNHNSFGTGTITLNDAATGSNNTALLIQNGAAVDITNNIIVSANGTGSSVIGSSEDSLIGSGLRFTGTLDLNRPTTLLGEFDRTTFAGVISGNVGTLTIGRSSGLEDFEMGRVVLEKDNTFTGNVVVEGFTNLQLNDVSNVPANTAKNQIPDTASVTLGDTSWLTLADSGTADDPETIGDLSSSFSTSRVRSLSAGSVLTYGTANDATFNGVVDGGNTFDLIKQGSGTQTFGGTLDNPSGRMIVNEGTVVLAKDSSNAVHAIGGLLTINNGGTVKLGGTYTVFRDLDTNRDSATQYQINAPANFGDQIYNNVDVTVNTGGVFDLNGKSETIDGLLGTGGTVTNNGSVASTLFLGAANSADTFPGIIQDGTSVVNIAKGGTGAMVFGGANTYTGTTHINTGALTITHVSALGSSSVGTFVTGNRDVPTAAGLSSLAISIATASDPGTPNIVAEPVTLTSEFAGDLRAQIVNTVESTRLTGLITVQGDGINQIIASQAAGDQFQINGGITGTATGTLFLRGNNEMALNSVINAPDVGVFKTDPGLLILNATGHDYRETNLVHGTVRADVVNALDTGAILRMGQNGNGNTFDLNGNNQQVAGLLINPGLNAQARTITSVAAATLTISNVASGSDYLFTGNITGAITLEKSGAGAQVLGTPASGTNSWTGNTVINDGVLRLANSDLIPDGAGAGNLVVGTGANVGRFDLNGNAETVNGLHGNANGLVSSNGVGLAVLTVNGTATPAVDATYAGAIQDRTDGGIGTLGLTKAGSGTQILTGINTYTGATNVNAGLLVVNGSLSGTSAVNVASGASIGGSGTLNANTTISGIVAPGNSIGTLTVSNDVTWNGGATASAATDWQFELGVGTADLLDITGAGSEFLKGTGSSFRFDFLGSGGAEGTYTLVQWDSTADLGGGALGTNFQTSDFSYVPLPLGYEGTFSFNGSSLQFIVVPEPSSLLLGGLGALALLRRRRTA